MNLASTIQSGWSRLWNRISSIVRNRYESAFHQWAERSWLPANVQDARFDADAATRIELVRRHRYWVRNSSIVQKIRNLFIQFSVGPAGLQVVPNSADEAWNESRRAGWDAWCRRPSINTNLTLTEEMILWAGALFDDGEVFVLKIAQKKGPPRIQTIEGHRCCTPTKGMAEKVGAIFERIIDGVELDASGKPMFYWFVDEQTPMAFTPGIGSTIQAADFQRIPAEFVIHGFKPRRPGMVRGIPEGFASLNILHDFQDCQLLHVKVAKRLASIANVVYNTTGEADVSNLRRQRLQIASQDAVGNPSVKDRAIYYEQKFGGETVYARVGEKVEQFNADRPSAAESGFMDLLLSQICCSYNVPKLLVVPYSLQGTVTRADLDICANAFRANFEVIARMVREVYEWQTQWAIDFDKSLDGETPEDFEHVVIRPPRSPNVDIGRNAAALKTELELGTITYQDVFAERQQDWRHQFRQAAEAAKFAKELAAEYGVEASEIIQKVQQKAAFPGQNQGGNGVETAPKAEKPEEIGA